MKPSDILTSSNHSAATWSASSCSSMVSESTVATSNTCDRLLLSPAHHATRAPFRSMQWSGFWSCAF